MSAVTPQGRILVIRGGAIGDFILTLPVLQALRAHFPQAHLEVLGYPHIAQLARAGGLADAVKPLESRALAGFFSSTGALDATWAAYFAGFHIVVSYLYDPDGIFQGNVAQCTRAQFHAGPHRPTDEEAAHATAVLLAPLQRLAVFEADPVPRLRLPSTPAPWPTGAWLAVHPGSGSERKNWPEPRWAALLDRLMHDTAWHLLLVGGEAEGDRLERLAAPLPAGRRHVARSRPLVELGQSLQHCRGFLGHDSGITHLAAALGLPGVALWGGSVEHVWRPLSPRVQVLRAPAGLARLEVDAVLETLAHAVPA